MRFSLHMQAYAAGFVRCFTYGRAIVREFAQF